MDFEEWKPIYELIVEEFGFSCQADEEAARVLNELLAKKDVYPLEMLRKMLSGSVTVCGNAPRLDEDLSSADLSGTVIAADGATSALTSPAAFPMSSSLTSMATSPISWWPMFGERLS